MMVVVAQFEAIFEDAADLDAGQREGLGIELKLIAMAGRSLGEQEVFRLADEGNDGSVGMNGARLDVFNLEVAMPVRNLDSGQFLALFLKNFDAHVDAMEMEWIVGDLLYVEVDGSGSGGFGVGGHLQFFVGGLLELGKQEGWRCDGKEQGQVAHEGRNPHGSFLILQRFRSRFRYEEIGCENFTSAGRGSGMKNCGGFLQTDQL